MVSESEMVKHMVNLADAGEGQAYATMCFLEKLVECLEAGRMPSQLLLRRLKKTVIELRKKHDEINRESIKLVSESGLSSVEAEKKVLQRRQRAISSALGYTREQGRKHDWMRDYEIAQKIYSLIQEKKVGVDAAIEVYLKQQGVFHLSEKRLRDIYYEYLELLR